MKPSILGLEISDQIVVDREYAEWFLSELYHLQGAIKTSLSQGANWLVSRIHPGGPILGVKNLNYVYKGVWGMYDAGVDPSILNRAFRWIETSLKPNGDFYFDEEPENQRIARRIYRPITFLKVAAWTGHPLSRNETIINRVLEYQHKLGGVYDYIGEVSGTIENERNNATVNNTCFFGHLMIALNQRQSAIAAGDWLRRYVEANKKHILDEGIIYTKTTIEGKLLTDFDKDSAIHVINLVDRKQEFWQVGTVMAYLALLYDTMRERWKLTELEAEPYLKAALEFNEFEAKMPHYSYLWPSKCKVAWGAGELLRVLAKYGNGTENQIHKAYSAARNTVITTFIDNQLPNGGWCGEHYVMSKSNPEYRFEYKPLKGIVNVPPNPIPGSSTYFVSGEEIAGEFLGEMKAVERGISALILLYLNILNE